METYHAWLAAKNPTYRPSPEVDAIMAAIWERFLALEAYLGGVLPVGGHTMVILRLLEQALFVAIDALAQQDMGRHP